MLYSFIIKNKHNIIRQIIVTMKLLRLLLSYYSKISSFMENKILSILKLLLPGKLYIIFIALLPLIKLLYRYSSIESKINFY